MADRAGKTITLTPKALDSRLRRAAAKALERERERYAQCFSDEEWLEHIDSHQRELDAARERGKEETRLVFPHCFTEPQLTVYSTAVQEATEKWLREEFARELAKKEAVAHAKGVDEGISDACILVSKALEYESPHPRDVPGLAFLSTKLLRDATRKSASPEAGFAFAFISSVFDLMQRLETATPDAQGA